MPDPAPEKVSARLDPSGRVEAESRQAAVVWWSVTKSLIAAATLRLAEDGAVALDAPLHGHPFTLRQLLQHRAGVGDYGALACYHAAVARGDRGWSVDELFERVPPGRLLFAPGTGWRYSNVGYLLVRQTLERAYGAGLRRVLADLVLRPSGLERSRLAETRADMDETLFAGGHGYDPAWVYHGTVIGPVAEAARALHGLIRGPLLSPASKRALLARHPIGGPVEGRPWRTTGYGLGLMMGTMRSSDMASDVTVAGHSAGGPGSAGAVYTALDPAEGGTVAVFTSGPSEAEAEAAAARCLARRNRP